MKDVNDLIADYINNQDRGYDLFFYIFGGIIVDNTIGRFLYPKVNKQYITSKDEITKHAYELLLQYKFINYKVLDITIDLNSTNMYKFSPFARLNRFRINYEFINKYMFGIGKYCLNDNKVSIITKATIQKWNIHQDPDQIYEGKTILRIRNKELYNKYKSQEHSNLLFDSIYDKLVFRYDFTSIGYITASEGNIYLNYNKEKMKKLKRYNNDIKMPNISILYL